jgi:hypothetical protein
MPSRLLWKGREQESIEAEQKTGSSSDGEREEAQKHQLLLNPPSGWFWTHTLL